MVNSLVVPSVKLATQEIAVWLAFREVLGRTIRRWSFPSCLDSSLAIAARSGAITLMAMPCFMLLVGCATGDSQPNAPKNMKQLTKLVGMVVELEGMPVSSKGEMHGLVTAFGKIEIGSAWPDGIIDEGTGVAPRVVVVGRLEKLAASTFHQPKFAVQAPYAEGEKLPERYVLRGWKIIRVLSENQQNGSRP